MQRTKMIRILTLTFILCALSLVGYASQEQNYFNGQTSNCQWNSSSNSTSSNSNCNTTTKQYFCVGDICLVLGNNGIQKVTVSVTPPPCNSGPSTATSKPTTVVPPTSNPTYAPTAKPTAKPTATPAATNGNYTPGSASAQEQESLNYVNEDRAKNNLPTLTMDPALQKLARMKSQDMSDNHYFAHESPTYGSASKMLKDAGYSFTSVGENIAHHATIYKAHAAFMSSDGHRRNILGSQWTRVGIGVAYDAQGYPYITQLFVR